ncbi:multidrug resistance-associated protein 1-like [Uloborus diversus]|uniref:multidrug resistance-associated protein 1-like n=1 Tax=Uloborus diversus TaxID=327109 RepID=UPI002409C767|nr:multidrug resistance-associated protein 1-like [Uloborus diversus]
MPDAVSQYIQAVSSIERLRNFFIANQQDSQVVGNNTREGEMLALSKASLSWSPEAEPTLENVDLSVSAGKLIAITGPVGSGKSSLLSAILGELYKTAGTIDLKGSIAYVPQQAWIQNRSLKHNILFLKPMKEEFYNKVLDCCCLRPDLDILPAGDETEIGEKGINLSGGQKQRVSLARAVYQNKDIYILDDPLSAVDVHVRKALFDDVIGSKGLLQNKTRILVTHDISVLPGVDLIVTIKDGKIVETGTYSELMKNEGAFSAFISEHANPNSAVNTAEQPKNYGRSLSRFASTDSEKSKKSLERSSSQDKNVKALLEKQDMARLIEEEKMETGGVKRGVYLSYVRHFSLLLFIPTVLGFLSYVTFEAGANVWLSKWNTDALQNTTNTTATTWRLSIYAALLCGQAISYTVAIIALLFGSTVAAKLYHKEMLNSVLRCPMSFFDTTPLGRIMNRFSADMDIADMQLIYVLEGWFDCLFFVTSGFVVIGIYTPIFLTTLLPLGVLYYILQKLHLSASRQIKRLESTTRSPLYSYFLESIQGVSSIKAYQAEKEFIENFDEILDKHITCYFNTLSCNSWLHFCLDILGCTMVLVATSLAVYHRSYLGAAVVALMITYALHMKNATAWIVRMNTDLENKSVSIERIDEYTHLESEADWSIPENEPPSNWPNKGEIIFDNYSTKYRKDLNLVLRDIDFRVNSNEKVGIVGRTGAGKSSVTLALFRIIEPVYGAIFIDRTDVSKIGLHALRSNISIIPQDPVLFTGSLRFNLDPNNDYDDEEIWRSLDSSNLKDFVSSLNKGLEHEVEEGGLNLSAGQRQLFCLARALLKKTKILVLDEATAAVDMDTDQRIQNTIRTALANHTVLTIAHRLNTVIDYDK